MPAIIISSISESAGKSTVAAALVAHVRDSGRSLNAAGGFGGLFDDDALVSKLDAAEIEASDDAVSIIEGSSGDAASDLELAERADASVVLIGTLEDDIEMNAQEYGDRLAGVVINRVTRYRDVHLGRVIDDLDAAGVRCLGCIPEDRRLKAPTIATIVDQLDGEVILDGEGLDTLIDNYLIGGLVLDWGPFYFKSEENICVIVRGGRPDVQISALQSETTRAVVMTGGERPIDYVYYEARTKRIPLIVVASDTEKAMERLDALSSGEFAHKDKLSRIRDLMNEGAMLSQIADLLATPATR